MMRRYLDLDLERGRTSRATVRRRGEERESAAGTAILACRDPVPGPTTALVRASVFLTQNVGNGV